jgi:predicted DNA-binding protein (MmcQ/YjbR family)
MTWEQLRAACLALPGAIETFSFGPGCSVFKAPNARMFAVSVTSTEPLDISVKCDPDIGADLRRTFAAITEGYHLDKRHWITVAANADVSDDLLCDLIRDSYDLVAARRPARRGAQRRVRPAS